MKTITPGILAPYSDILTAAFTTRHGGLSQVPYDSANLAFHVGDDPRDVVQNHALLGQTLGYAKESLVFMRQIHSDLIVRADGYGFENPPQCDALITDQSALPLMVMSADCTPILLFDPIRKAIAAIHAGREGALQKILPKTIESLKEHYESDAADIIAVLGPSIHGCCYEVNGDIAQRTIENGYSGAVRHDGERVYLDVNTILLDQLEQSGVRKIEVVDACTSCNHLEYFSYRADKQRTGRIAGVILLR